LLILLCLALRKLTGFDAGGSHPEAGRDRAYALAINIFLILAESSPFLQRDSGA